MSTESGVDVSKWQGRIDWDEARHQIGFAMVKATEGTRELDRDYLSDIGRLRSFREPRGSYHYPDAGDPVHEAAYYVGYAARRNGEMQALDFEGAVLELDDPVGWAHAWLSEVLRRTDNLPLIYMSGATVHRFDWRRVVELGAGLWVASWGEKPDPGQWPFVIMWQRDDDGHVHGIDGDVDQDVFFGNAAIWAAYANNRTTVGLPNAPTPGPTHPEPEPEPHPQPHPHPVPEPTHDEGPAEYVVQDGDTLSRIAHRFHTTDDHLVRLNEHEYPTLGWNRNLIQVGWKLRLS